MLPGVCASAIPTHFYRVVRIAMQKNSGMTHVVSLHVSSFRLLRV